MEVALPVIFFKVILLQHAEDKARSNTRKDLASSY